VSDEIKIFIDKSAQPEIRKWFKDELEKAKKQSTIDFSKRINVLIDFNSPEISLDKIYNVIKKKLKEGVKE
jgi:outer membrane protein OmpA-like peptidoglycan-associated protein